MKAPLAFAAVLAALGSTALPAQTAPGLGELLVSANRDAIPFAQINRPVVGLKRRADAMVQSIWVESDTRESATRFAEIHSVLAALVDRAAQQGLQLVTGSAQLQPVTRANYKSLEMQSAGRIDTSRVMLMVRAPLGADAEETKKRLAAFIAAARGSGRATVTGSSYTALTVIDPDQYRDAIITLVAEDAKHTAGLFGPGFSFSLSGIDRQITWWQVSPTEVFLTLPYSYQIVPR